jgi:hypothetical protein
MYKAAMRKSVAGLSQEVQHRLELEASGADYEGPVDLVQTMLEMTKQGDVERQPKTLAELVVTLSGIAGHSTAATGGQALWDFAMRPEFIDMVREEALNTLGESEMRFTRATLNKMWKLDSLLRELVFFSLAHFVFATANSSAQVSTT